MKAKVIWKFNSKLRLQLEDGRIVQVIGEQIRSLNPVLSWGDTGTLYKLPTGQIKFRVDAEDADILGPDDHIHTNKVEESGIFAKIANAISWIRNLIAKSIKEFAVIWNNISKLR